MAALYVMQSAMAYVEDSLYNKVSILKQEFTQSCAQWRVPKINTDYYRGIEL